MRSDRFVSRMALGVIIAAFAVVSATAAVGYRQTADVTRLQSYLQGSVVDVPSDLYANSERTMLVFVRESCSVCQAEAPQISTMVKALGSFDIPVPSIVVTGSSQVEADANFAKSIGASRQVHVPFSTLKLRTVPTILLVDQKGTVLFSQEGRSKSINVMEELIQRIPSR